MKFRFLKNAAYLTLTGFLLRGLGMIFRVYISKRIGEVGMGVYQLITSAYFLFISLAQAGLSGAVTKICAAHFAKKDAAGAGRTLADGVKLALAFGSLSMLAMLGLSGIISRMWIADIRALYSLRVLSLSLPFIAVCGVLSGYFTASRAVIFGCAAQIIEQISRLAVAAFAIVICIGKPLEILLCAVLLANTVSEAISCGFLAVCYALSKKSAGRSEKSERRSIMKIAMPTMMTRTLVSTLHTAENMLVPSAMTLYTGSRALSLSQFGALKGMALPLLFFPFSFLAALSSLLLPEMSEAHALGDTVRCARLAERTCRITILISVMTGGVFFLFADSLARFIYGSDTVALILKLLAPLVPFMYLDSICDGMLKGLGRQKRVFYNNCIDSVLRIVLIAVLVPAFGLYGFIAMMVVSNVTVSVLNFSLLLSACKIRNRLGVWWLRPLAIAIVSAVLTKFILPFSETLPKMVLGSLLFCLFFGSLAAVFELKNKKCKKY